MPVFYTSSRHSPFKLTSRITSKNAHSRLSRESILGFTWLGSIILIYPHHLTVVPMLHERSASDPIIPNLSITLSWGHNGVLGRLYRIQQCLVGWKTAVEEPTLSVIAALSPGTFWGLMIFMNI